MPFLCRAVFHPGRGNGLTSFWLVFVLHSPGPVFAVLAALVALPGDFLIFGASQKPGKRSSCTAPAFWIFAVSPVLLHDDWAKKRGGNVEFATRICGGPLDVPPSPKSRVGGTEHSKRTTHHRAPTHPTQT